MLKLVLLPGMDGTGKLFGEFLRCYTQQYSQCEYQVISLPESGEQDYEVLVESIVPQLPQEEYILLVESFSGGLIPYIIKSTSSPLQGIVFVASFLSSPSRILLAVAQWLPLSMLVRIPGLSYFYRGLFLGRTAPAEILEEFLLIVKQMPGIRIKSRLRAMLRMVPPSNINSDIPCVYIQARKDRLVDPDKAKEISVVFPRCRILVVDGPHFILQTRARESAIVIADAIASLSS